MVPGVVQVGPHIVVFKTHVDAFDAWDDSIVQQLQALAQKHGTGNFADIGNTVVSQYRDGIYKIASWSDITNAYILTGPGINRGAALCVCCVCARECMRMCLHQGAGKRRECCFSKGGDEKVRVVKGWAAGAAGDFTAATAQAAEDNLDFVMGFISQNPAAWSKPPSPGPPTLSLFVFSSDFSPPYFASTKPLAMTATGQWAEEDGEGVTGLVHMTPGVQLQQGGDALGQQYNTPDHVIGACGSDIIIVGRGIVKAADPAAAAIEYKAAGWCWKTGKKKQVLENRQKTGAGKQPGTENFEVVGDGTVTVVIIDTGRSYCPLPDVLVEETDVRRSRRPPPPAPAGGLLVKRI
eukprot:jgi/Botrbrau1/20721/Bobra.0058s0050.1